MKLKDRRKLRQKYAQGAVKYVKPDYPLREGKIAVKVSAPKIGIGITTRNRDSFPICYKQITRTLPKGAKLVVVDDESTIPVPEATFRFNHNVGVAAAKNKCLELLEGCDYIFLFDDDCWPVKKGWEKPYINSGLHHASFTFDHNRLVRNGNDKIGELGALSYFKNACGCMLFFTGEAIQTAGGFNRAFGKYGNEHIDLSVRIYNAGLTPHPFMDVTGSMNFFHSLDYYLETKSTATHKESHKTYHLIGAENRALSYKTHGGNFTVMGTFFNYQPDPQRGIKWEPDFDLVKDWVNSVIDNGGECHLLHDCFTDLPKIKGFTAHKVSTAKSFVINNYRWIAYHNILKHLKIKTDFLFLTDTTDVICLKAPEPEHGFLYVGDEKDQKLDNPWLKRIEETLITIPDYHEIIWASPENPLLNIGILGGDIDLVKLYLSVHYEINFAYNKGKSGSTDMATGNYVLYKYFQDKIKHGEMVNTVFKEYRANNFSWFMHK